MQIVACSSETSQSNESISHDQHIYPSGTTTRTLSRPSDSPTIASSFPLSVSVHRNYPPNPNHILEMHPRNFHIPPTDPLTTRESSTQHVRARSRKLCQIA